jgi:putative colanic acid biosynthesis acetyltransferase WcaF
LCTGSHDWNKKRFDLITKPISIQDHSWLAGKSVVGPGVTVEEGAVLSLGSVTTTDLRAWWIHQGNPATPLRERIMETEAPGAKKTDESD